MAEMLGRPERVATYAEAATLGLADALADNPALTVFCPAEQGGPAGVVAPLVAERAGPQRLVRLPGSELVRAAVAHALAGGWPLVQIAADDLLRGAGLGELVVYALDYARQAEAGAAPRRPLTVRTWLAGDAAHVLEGWLMHVQGLRLTLPAIPSDAYRLLRSAIRHDYPTVVAEHPALMDIGGEIRPASHAPAGQVKVMRAGRDLTILATARMVHVAVAAADALASAGIESEVLDLRWLAPLDRNGITASIARTRRCVVALADFPTAGASAELAHLAQATSGVAVARVQGGVDDVVAADVVAAARAVLAAWPNSAAQSAR